MMLRQRNPGRVQWVTILRLIKRVRLKNQSCQEVLSNAVDHCAPLFDLLNSDLSRLSYGQP